MSSLNRTVIELHNAIACLKRAHESELERGEQASAKELSDFALDLQDHMHEVLTGPNGLRPVPAVGAFS